MGKQKRSNKSKARNRQKGDANRPPSQDNTMLRRREQKDEEIDPEDMKKWIESLTLESFLDALKFSFHSDGLSGDSGSYDFDLLMEMLSLQFHHQREKKANGFIDRCYSWRKSMRGAIETPCLFKWGTADSENPQSPKPKMTEQTAPSAPVSDATSLPSELLDVLAKAGVKRSESELLETFNEADELFDDESERGGNNSKLAVSPEPLKYNVECHQGIADDGESMGRGTTIEQQNADRSMLLWTTLVWDRALGIDDDTRSKAPHSMRSTILPTCAVRIPEDMTDDDLKRKELILHTLRVASRGKFLTESVKASRGYLTRFAPWFSPIGQWFSLPLYLSSSFESSLWDAYLLQRMDSSVSCVGQCDGLSGESSQNSLVDSVTNLSDDAMKRVLCYAIKNAIKKDDMEKRDECNMPDTLLWKLISWSESGNDLPSKRELPRNNFAQSSLLEWDTPISQLRSLLVDHLQDGMVVEAERSLLEGVAQESMSSKKASTKKKKKKAYSKPKEEYQFTIDDVDYVQSDDGNTSDDCEPFIEMILPHETSEIADPCHGATLDRHTKVDENSTKMSVLKIIDEILSDVFARVGIEDDEFADFTDALTVKSRGESAQRQFISRSLDKSRSADDIEVATTAVVSNIGADAAIRLLQQNAHRRRPSFSSVQSQQLWASRSCRQTINGENPKYCGSNLKRSKSSEDRSSVKKKTQPRSDGDNSSCWPSSDSPLLPEASRNETSIFDGAPLCLSGALDGWNSVACQKQDDNLIFTDILQQDRPLSDYDKNLVSSTAASIASSRGDVDAAGLDIDCDIAGSSALQDCGFDANKEVHLLPPADTTYSDLQTDAHSPTPSAPPSPPPQLSPILVSLADLGKLREEAAGELLPEKMPPVPPYTIPIKPRARTLTPSMSRDDLRSIDRKSPSRIRDDHHTMGHRQVDALLSYRNVVAQSVPRKPPSLKSIDGKQKHRDDAHPILTRSTRSIKTTRSGWRPGPEFPNLSSSVASQLSLNKEPILNKVIDVCARSEGGLTGADDASHCNVIPRAQTDDTMTKDGVTTISSVHSEIESEHFSTMKEERNSYRDMCLTLGAENAKLRNLLASKMCDPMYHPGHHPAPFAQEAMPPHMYRNDYQMWPMQYSSFPNQFSSRSIVAMSDAGMHQESIALSEDGYSNVLAFGESQSVSRQAKSDSVSHGGRRISEGETGGETYTYAESDDYDASVELNTGGQDSHVFSGLHGVHVRDSFTGPIPHGNDSRLTKDINRYMKVLRAQLKKSEPRRLRVVEGITKIVKALWPRAQIKMYGSHMTKLCLPTSDIDFVISLPAVHKNTAIPTAPGDLEGRNAIIETNQKVLARRLKSETWLDQRTIKVIERTAVPVIKVSTSDTRSRVVQLDLSFDAKEHHGLEALDMIQQVLQQLPMIRPLVLVLKQFLLDRGLLTAYTGGLSSYCLFLMVARYCQEQAPTWNDCGSLLMGFLDFYGNFFDPRITGISVRTRRYFYRSDEPQYSQEPRFQPLNRQFSFQNAQTSASQQVKSGKLDPIWVEDPLNPGNNVGRNAFRIFQVQRAFSDAHRALVASLEWDNDEIDFGDDSEYPLLKSLLQNEDTFFPIDDPIHR